jgi:hypothetical protein
MFTWSSIAAVRSYEGTGNEMFAPLLVVAALHDGERPSRAAPTPAPAQARPNAANSALGLNSQPADAVNAPTASVADLNGETGTVHGKVIVTQGAVAAGMPIRSKSRAPGGRASRMEATGHVDCGLSLRTGSRRQRRVYDVGSRVLRLNGNGRS